MTNETKIQEATERALPEQGVPGAPVRTAPSAIQASPARARLVLRPAARRAVKRAIWVVVALAIAGAIALGLRPTPVPVETAVAARGTLLVTVDEDGRSRVKDRYTISAPLAGTVARPALHAGDSVLQGQVVARLVPLATPLLDPRARAEAQARVAGARAVLRQAGAVVASARAAAEFSSREAARQHALFEGGASPRQAVEQADLADRMRQEERTSAEYGARVAAAEVRLAEAALARLGAQSSEEAFTVRAPAAGVVLRLFQESEVPVQPGAPLLEIGDPAALEVVVDVLTTDAIAIDRGAPVRIERWGGDSTLSGHVRRVEPSAFTRLSALGVEEQRVNVLVDLDPPRSRWSGLGDGYRVEASIVVWEGRDRLLIPSGAVFRQGSGWAAYTADQGRARLRSVELGRGNGIQVEVTRGLEPGERAILYPTDNVKNGVRVEE